MLLTLSSAHAVLRSPFPRKPAAPNYATVVTIGELKRAK